MSNTNIPIIAIGLEEENKYLKLSIIALREQMEVLHLSIDDTLQAEKRKSANEVSSLKQLVKSIRDELEHERIQRDELIQKASAVIYEPSLPPARTKVIVPCRDHNAIVLAGTQGPLP